MPVLVENTGAVLKRRDFSSLSLYDSSHIQKTNGNNNCSTSSGYMSGLYSRKMADDRTALQCSFCNSNFRIRHLSTATHVGTPEKHSHKLPSRGIPSHFKWLASQLSREDLKINQSKFSKSFSSPAERDFFIEYLLRYKRYPLVWKFCQYIKSEKLGVTFTTYILLLKAIAESSASSNSSELGCILFEEAMNMKIGNITIRLSEDQKWLLCRNLLLILTQSEDMIDCVKLNELYTKYFQNFKGRQLFELQYCSTYITILLRSGQTERAVDEFEKTLRRLEDSGYDLQDILKELPILRLLLVLQRDKDFDNILKWLTIVQEIDDRQRHQDINDNKRIISNELWVQFLDTALSSNHYKLVKLVYDHFIMRGFSNSTISIEDAIFEDLTTKDSGFNYINDDTTFQILHTLSGNGDVDLTLSLIESHYIHKKFKGERALNKELYIKIIEAYCYSDKLTKIWNESEPGHHELKDTSIEQILSVINGIMEKLEVDKEEQLNYRDISVAMSSKFWSYSDHDKNIEKAVQKRNQISDRILHSEENETVTTVLPRKMANTNIESSQYGNLLANLDVLHDFVGSHTQYMLNENLDSSITIFINCILEHLHIHQNFTSIVRTLQSLFHVEHDFATKWLDKDLFDIIFNSLANSSSSKLCSLTLFNYFKESNKILSHENYYCLMSAVLRGYFHDGLQFYLYHYLLDYGGMVDDKIIMLLREIPKSELRGHENTHKIFEYVADLSRHSLTLSRETIDGIWDEWHLCKNLSRIAEEKPTKFNRIYHKLFDERDCGYLEFILKL